MKKVITQTTKETQNLATQLAKEIITQERCDTDSTGAVVITLSGELGAGKTTFAQGFLAQCGAERPYTSPTFNIIKLYDIKYGDFRTVYHIDPYRITSKDLVELGWEEMLDDSKSIILLEWPSIVADIVPKNARRVTLKHKDENTREVEM